MRDRTQLGAIEISANTCKRLVSSHTVKLFSILDTKSLNTTKFLDYAFFKKAFYLYNQRMESKDLEYKSLLRLQILELKNSMNRQRTNFTLPSDLTIKVTPWWLLRFSEGESSFSVRGEGRWYHTYMLSQTERQLPVLLQIKNFFLNEVSCSKDSLPIINIQYFKDNRGNTQPLYKLILSDSIFISKYLIPLFDNLTFLSKKGNDYQDWKTLLCPGLILIGY